MIGAIAGVGSANRSPFLYRVNQRAQQLAASVNSAATKKTSGVHGTPGVAVTRARAAQPDAPVEAVDAVKPVRDGTFNRDAMLHYMASDPVEAAVRSRIQYVGNGEDARAAQGLTNAGEDRGAAALSGAKQADENAFILPGMKREDENAFVLPGGKKEDENVFVLPGQKKEDENVFVLPGQKQADEAAFILPGAKEADEYAAALPGQEKAAEQLPGVKDEGKAVDGGEDEEKGVPVEETESAREVAEEAECQTCKRRKYQDGSDDPGVSFKAPTRVDPKMAMAAVRGHENEHVVREQAKARQEDRKVVSQSVRYQTAICPECGKVYVAGGTTRTVTVKQPKRFEPEQNRNDEIERKPFSVEA